MNARFLLSISVAAAACIGPAFAQSDEEPARETRAGAEEEIIVTATRREERLQDVPLSITAFTPKDMAERGIVGYEGLREAPGVVLNRPTQNFNNFTARGIATNGYSANLQSAVAIYVDELPISANGNSTILDPNIFDVERVEFLRGPQGTLFGSGSLSGAVRIINNSPDLDEVDYSWLVDFGQTGSDSYRQRYNGMINMPLVKDTLGLRLVGYYRDEDGYLDNVGTGVENSNSLEALGGRAMLQWEPTERLSVRLTGSHEDSDPADSSLINPTLGERTRRSDRPDLFQAELSVVNVTVQYDFDGADFTSSTTGGEFDQLFVVDLAGTFGQAIAFALDAYAYDELFVEEARLASDPGGKWDWVVGAFHMYKRRDVDYNYRSNPEFLDAANITGLSDEFYQRFGGHSIIHETAAFGELSYHLTEDFWLTGGLRYSEIDVQSFTEPGGYNSNYLTVALTGGNAAVTIFPVAAATGPKAVEEGESYKFSASWRPVSNMTTYATYSTGFRPPSPNARAGLASIVDPNDIIIPPGATSDELQNYEIGLKGNWFDGALTGNFALYHIDWTNIQVQANRVSDQVQFATNIGAAESNGLEFEIAAYPGGGFEFYFSGAFNEAEVTELTANEAAISGAVEGARLSSPKFSGSGTVRYNFDLGDDIDAYVSASIQYVGAYPGMFPNVPGNPNATAPTYGFTDNYEAVTLAAGATFGDWLVRAYIENATDDDSITYVHPEAFIDGRFGTLRPRTFGVRLGYRL